MLHFYKSVPDGFHERLKFNDLCNSDFSGKICSECQMKHFFINHFWLFYASDVFELKDKKDSWLPFVNAPYLKDEVLEKWSLDGNETLKEIYDKRINFQNNLLTECYWCHKQIKNLDSYNLLWVNPKRECFTCNQIRINLKSDKIQSMKSELSYKSDLQNKVSDRIIELEEKENKINLSYYVDTPLGPTSKDWDPSALAILGNSKFELEIKNDELIKKTVDLQSKIWDEEETLMKEYISTKSLHESVEHTSLDKPNFCKQCGNKLDHDAKFCSKCGVSLS